MHDNDEEWFVGMRVITMIALPCLPFVCGFVYTDFPNLSGLEMIDRSHSATGAMVAIVPKFPKLLEMLILLPADRDNRGWTPPPLMDKANDPSLLLPAFTANVSVSYSIICLLYTSPSPRDS